MATMPGLPMFGHGQVEGFAEKYGMEYPARVLGRAARTRGWSRRHEREIFPLLHRRRRCSPRCETSCCTTSSTPSGNVNEDVFAYSNRSGGERSLVVYHNRYADGARLDPRLGGVRRQGARRRARVRAPHARRGPGAHRRATATTAPSGTCGPASSTSGRSRELCERGLYVELGAYRCHVFVDVREVRDEAGLYAELARELGGEGVPSLDAAMRDLALRPVQEPVAALVSGDVLRRLLAARQDAAEAGRAPVGDPILDEVERLGRAAIEAAARVAGTWRTRARSRRRCACAWP